MVQIIVGWQQVVNERGLVKANPGEEKFIADLITLGLKYTEKDVRRRFVAEVTRHMVDDRYNCPIHGLQDGPDCPLC
jgi:hypothetical protein